MPEESTGQDTEPDFDLVEPRAMLRGVDKADAVGGILEEDGARGHGLQDALLFLAPEIPLDGAPQRDEFHQTGRLVGIELVTDEDPFALRVEVDGGTEVGDDVRLGAGVADGGGDGAPGGDLEVGARRLGTVAFVLELHRLGIVRAHRLIGMNGFESLNAGLLIRGDDRHPLRMEFRRLMVELADRADRFSEGGLVFDLGIEPRPGAMRLEVRLILKNGQWCWPKSSLQCRARWSRAPNRCASNASRVPAAFRRPAR